MTFDQILMSEDTKQADGELFDTEAPESSSDAASTTDEDQEDPESSESEESEEILDLDDKSSAEVQKQKQVDAWAKKIESGEAALEDLPKHQKWLKKPLEKLLEKSSKDKKISEEYDIDALLEQKLQQKEDDKEFKALRGDLNDAKLSQKQRIELKTEYEDLRSSGLSKAKALQKALRIVGLELETSDRRSKMTAPKAAPQVGDDVTDENFRSTMSEKERVKRLIELSDGNMTPN